MDPGERVGTEDEEHETRHAVSFESESIRGSASSSPRAYVFEVRVDGLAKICSAACGLHDTSLESLQANLQVADFLRLRQDSVDAPRLRGHLKHVV